MLKSSFLLFEFLQGKENIQRKRGLFVDSLLSDSEPEKDSVKVGNVFVFIPQSSLIKDLFCFQIQENIMESNLILNSCPQLLFKAILCIIHAALRSFQTIQACALSWWRLYVSSSLKMFDGWPSQKPCPLSLRKDVDEIQKLPKHLGIVLTEKSNASMIEDLSNLVSWAVCFGVPYISFYKNEGTQVVLSRRGCKNTQSSRHKARLESMLSTLEISGMEFD